MDTPSRDMDEELQAWLPGAGGTLDNTPAAPRDLYERLRFGAELLAALPQAPAEACLVFSDSSGDTRQHVIGRTCVVGRETPAELIIDSAQLSARHFEVRVEDGVALLQDLNSRNGTFLNGARVTQAPLRSGDIIEAGQRVIAYFGSEDGGPKPR